MTNRNIGVSDFSRVFLIEFGAAPNRTPSYEGQWMAGSVTWSLGDVTPIYIPSADAYAQFDIAGKIIGERGSPTLPITARYLSDQQSVLLRIARNGCDHDLQVHIGKCQNPQDFNGGWDKIAVLENARPTDYGTTDLGAMAPGDRAVVNEDVPFDGEEYYEIVRIQIDEQAAAEIVQEIIDVIICDMVTCGECGVPSNGCDVALALTLTAGGSPGLPAEIIFTDDGGVTYGQTNISTLAANEDPNEFSCVGINVVVVSEDSDSLHFAPLADILAGTEVWTEVTTGFVATNGPLAIYSSSPRHTWIVGENGFIYFTEDPTSSVTAQDAGVVTTDNLNSVHALDTENVIAGGDNGALVRTSNGGATWSLITTNAAILASTINTVWMKTLEIWFVGIATGQLFFTDDAGVTWTEITFPGSGAGNVRDIQFASNTVGYMAHDTATPAGRILRTIDGGHSWYVAPESNLVIPANDRINAIAPCEDNVNIAWAGGLADNATDGILVKAVGP